MPKIYTWSGKWLWRSPLPQHLGGRGRSTPSNPRKGKVALGYRGHRLRAVDRPCSPLSQSLPPPGQPLPHPCGSGLLPGNFTCRRELLQSINRLVFVCALGTGSSVQRRARLGRLGSSGAQTSPGCCVACPLPPLSSCGCPRASQPGFVVLCILQGEGAIQGTRIASQGTVQGHP